MGTIKRVGQGTSSPVRFPRQPTRKGSCISRQILCPTPTRHATGGCEPVHSVWPAGLAAVGSHVDVAPMWLFSCAIRTYWDCLPGPQRWQTAHGATQTPGPESRAMPGRSPSPGLIFRTRLRHCSKKHSGMTDRSNGHAGERTRGVCQTDRLVRFNHYIMSAGLRFH
jgi:hypothetical protein